MDLSRKPGNVKGKDNPDHYKFGIFYFNPEDSRVLIPKRRMGVGWSLNFASPFSWLILLAIILLAIALNKLK